MDPRDPSAPIPGLLGTVSYSPAFGYVHLLGFVAFGVGGGLNLRPGAKVKG